MTVQSRIRSAAANGFVEYRRWDMSNLGDERDALQFVLRQAVAGDDATVSPVTPLSAEPSLDGGGGGTTDAHLVSNPQNHTDGGTLELDGLSSIVSADVGGFTYVFAAGAEDDGVSVFRLNAGGTLTPVFDVTDAGALELDGARGLSTAMVDGNTYLFAVGELDDGVSVFRVNVNGTLTAVHDVTDDATLRLDQASDTATARVGTSTYLFVAGQTDDGISVFRVAGSGRLTSVGNFADAGATELDGVRALATATVGGIAYLIAGGGADDGVSVFSINGTTGALTNIVAVGGNITDGGALELDGVSDITTAVIGSTTYVYVAGADDSGVSVFTLSAAGVLTGIDNETDSAATLIGGANSLAVHTFGQTTYLLVGGSENGLSLYRIENGSNNSAAGTLTFVENIADAGSLELAGVVATGSASVGGTSYILGGGATDDGFSNFGSSTTGQIWYTSEGNLADARLAYFNTNGGLHTSVMDNTPSIDIGTGFVESVAVDTAAGLYFILATGNEGINAKILMGRIGSAAPPTVVFTFDPGFPGPTPGSPENNLAFGLEIDTINERLYVGYIEFLPNFTDSTQGIRQFSYNVTTGAVTGGTFFVTEATAGTPSSAPGGDGLFASRDLDIDTTHNVLYSQSLALGDGFETNVIMRFSLSAPGAGTVLVNPALFPLNGNGTDFTTLNGIIADIEVDEDSNRLYFLTRAEDVEEAGGEDSIWMVANASTASNATPTEVTLVGSADFPFVLANFYPTDMIMDEVNNILYVESENSNLVGGGTTDSILVFQLDAAGTTATLVNMIPMNFGTTANVEGLHFNYLPTMSGLTGTVTAIGEQGAAVDLLSVAPGLFDFDGDHFAGATVQITGGSFNSNENSFNDDDLGVGSGMTQSGLIAGTNITVTWNQATGTLTLTGYDIFANYVSVLNSIHFQSSGDNPTNFGLNPNRTITWTISDGSPNIPTGSANSKTTQITLTAVNDDINHNGISDRVMAEDTPLSITGLSITDPDLNPGITDITVTLTATNGTVALLTNVEGGLTAADIANNGTGLVTITATLNEINATLAAVNGLLFTNTPDFNGPASVTISSSDGGNTGTGGIQTDLDTINITVNAVVDIANDAPSFAEDSGAQNLDVLANDTFENPGRFISAFTQGAHGTVTLNDNNTVGDLTDDFLVYTQVADYNGTDSFTYTVTSGGVTEIATVNVTITAVADAVNDPLNFAEDAGAQSINVLANDTFENPGRFISSVTQGAHGSVTINDNGTAGDLTDDFLVYTQVADYNGTDSFTYTVTSGGVTETATVNVMIGAVQDIADDSVTVNEDSGPNALNGVGNPVSLLANDSFENAGRFISAVTQGTHGSVAIDNNGTAGDATDDYVVYTVTDPNYNGADTFTYTVTSGGVTETATVNVNIAAVNDAPVNTVPLVTQNLNEDGTLAFTGGNAISVADVDLGAGSLTVTLTVLHGVLTLSGTAGLTFSPGGGDGTADATMTFSGTAAAINTALNGLIYAPNLDYNGPDTLSITTNDNGNTGSPGALQDVDTVDISVTAQNDTPVVAVASSASSTEQVAGTIDAAATITDVELGALNDYAGSSLTVGRNGGAQPEDLLSFGPSGAFTANGGNLEAPGGLVFATFTGGNGTPLVITFTGSGTPATQALVNAVVQSLQYTYTGDTPPASIVMNYSFNDGAPGNAGQGAGGSPTGTDAITINITDTPENTPPVLDLNGAAAGDGSTASVTEQSGFSTLAPDLTVTDVDDTNLEGATVTIGAGFQTSDLLSIGGVPNGTSGTISWTYDSVNGVLDFTGSASLADYQALLRQVAIETNGDDPGTSRTVTWTVTDGTASSNVPTTAVTVTGLNDPPFVNATGSTPTFTEGDAPVDLFSAVNVVNFEAGQTFTSLTLTVTNVTDGANEVLRIDGSDVALTNGNSVTTATNSLTVTVTVAAGVATVTFSGASLTEVQLETLVDSITYANVSQNPTDADRVITITQVVDSGANGGGEVNNSNPNVVATVNVNPVNDTPINTVPGTQTINEDGSVTLSTGNGNAISVADADATTLTVTLTIQHGTLTLASTAGLSFGAGDGTADLTMTFSGTAAAINAALGSGLTYNPNGNFNGSDSIAVFTTDNGQSGGPAQTDSDPIAINITAINDAPVVIGDGTESATTINEDTPGAGQTIQALFAGQYSDQADNQVPNGGASSPGQFSGIAVTANDSSASTGQWQYFSGGVWTDIGTVSDGAAKLLGDPFVTLIRFNPAPDFNGPAPTLTVHLIDNSLGFGIVNGQVVDLSGVGATGGTTAYSTGTVVLSQDVIAINDGPLNTVPGAQTINEDASVTLSTANGNAIQVADVDATTLTVTLTVQHGTLTLASTAGLSFSGGSDGTADVTMTFSGTAAAINAALGSGLTYNPTANYNGPDSIAVLTTDGGQTGTGGTLQDNDSIAITVNSVNDEPTSANVTINNVSEDDPYVFQTSDFAFSDVDGNMPFTVRFTSLPADGDILLNGVAIQVNDEIAYSAIAAGMLTFQPDPDEFGTPYTSFTFQVRDNGGVLNGGDDLSATYTATINVDPDNLPPAVDLDGVAAGIDASVSYTEDAPGVAIGSGVTVTDPDVGLGDMIESATITLTDRVAGDALTLTGSLPGGFVAVTTNLAGSITIQITGTGTGAQYQALIQSILYSTTNQDPTVGGTDTQRTINVTVNDGQFDSPVATTTVTITPSDDAPVAQPDAFTIDEATVLTGSLFADNGSGPDSDPDGPPLAISAVNGNAANVGTQINLASGALLTVNADGSFTYDTNHVFDETPTPGSGASNQPAHDSFTYTLAGANTVTVSLTINGLDTDDLLLGTAGSDFLIAGVGDDILVGGASSDFMDGGDGIDTATFANPLSFTDSVIGWVVSSAEGNDVLQNVEIAVEGSGQRNLLVGSTGFATVQAALNAAGTGDNVRLATGNYAGTFNYDDDGLKVFAQPAAVLNAIFATATTFGITVVGGALNDDITTGAGSDLLIGNGGADRTAGGAGDDRYYVDNAGDVVVEAVGGGFDRVLSSISHALAAGAEVELLAASSSSATTALNFTGNAFANTIYGNAGVNVLVDGGGADVLHGLAGDDRYYVSDAAAAVIESVGGGLDVVFASVSYTLTPSSQVEILSAVSASATTAINLTGNGFANTLYGNAGDNVLDGKLGNDLLIGFGGADTFAFTTALGANNVDAVRFEAGDKIALDDAVFTGLGLGALDPNAFVTGTAAQDANDRIIYNQATGQLYFDADGNGAGAAILFATLQGAPVIHASDFTVI